jgi:hypothetical protein
MNFLSSSQSTSVPDSSLLGQDWNPAKITSELILTEAERVGIELLANQSERIMPTTSIEPGALFLGADANQNSISLVRRRSEFFSLGFSHLDSSLTLMVDSRGKAYTSIGLGPETNFDGRLSVYRMQSPEAVISAWAWLNSGTLNPWISHLRHLFDSSSIINHGERPLLVPRKPGLDQSQYALFQKLAEQVNGDIYDDDLDRSSFEVRELKHGSRWNLRESKQSEQQGVELNSIVKQVFAGAGLPSKDPKGLPSSGGQWLRTGKISTYQDPHANRLVLAKPGNVVTPSIGLISQARVVEEDMVVANGHYLLLLQDGTDPQGVANFLNSRVATQQRRNLAQGSIIPRLSKADLIKFRFLETRDYRFELKTLFEQVIRK